MCREAYASCGYSPFLCFEVEDLQARVQRLLELGAVLDGPIKYADRGKVGCDHLCWHLVHLQGQTPLLMLLPSCRLQL